MPVNKAKYVALLRGINVGGKNKLPMKRLATMFTDVGCSDVETYIQSGNVVFAAPSSVAKSLPSAIAAAITGQFGCRVSVVIRSAKELADVVDNNPFLKRGVDTGTLHVAFLVSVPDAKHVAELDGRRSPGDAFEIRGRHIYLRMPNGMARSKLTNDYFDRTLKTTSTLRNWNTVQKLLEMTRNDASYGQEH
ncbi:MAG: DUF1697 domain-containing protein [Nitrospirales bacterium]